MLDTPMVGAPVTLYAAEFENTTGAWLAVTRVPWAKLHQDPLQGLRQDMRDAPTAGSMWIAHVRPRLQPLAQDVQAPRGCQDGLPLLRAAGFIDDLTTPPGPCLAQGDARGEGIAA